MAKRLTVTLSERTYSVLERRLGRQKVPRFLEGLARTHANKTDLNDEYRKMAAEEASEREALEWCEAVIGDVVHDPR